MYLLQFSSLTGNPDFTLLLLAVVTFLDSIARIKELIGQSQQIINVSFATVSQIIAVPTTLKLFATNLYNVLMPFVFISL